MINGNEFILEREGQKIAKQIPVDFIAKLIEEGKGAFISPRYPFVVGQISESSLNIKSGLQSKDMIVAINNRPVKYFDQAEMFLSALKNQEVSLSVKRGKKD